MIKKQDELFFVDISHLPACYNSPSKILVPEEELGFIFGFNNQIIASLLQEQPYLHLKLLNVLFLGTIVPNLEIFLKDQTFDSSSTIGLKSMQFVWQQKL